MTVNLDATPAPAPFVPPWLTVGAQLHIITGARYGNSDKLSNCVVKTIGKRDIVVTYRVNGRDLSERWRHTDYTDPNRQGMGFPDTYQRWHSNGRVGGYPLILAHPDNPAIARTKLLAAVDNANNVVRNLMSKYGKGSIEENATLAYRLGEHTGALQQLEEFDTHAAKEKAVQK